MMTNKQAQWILVLLTGVSLIILTLSGLGLWTKPADADTMRTSSDFLSGDGAASQPTQPPTTTIKAAVPLSITMQQPEPTPALGMRRWPADSSIEIIHDPELEKIKSQAGQTTPLQGITVILDAGHGGQDGGTCYPINAADPLIIEKNITLAVTLQARDRLQELGAKVVMTRDGDDWKSVYYRIALAGNYILGRFEEEATELGRLTEGFSHLRPLMTEVMTINSDTAESGGRGIMKGVGANADLRLLMDIEHQYQDVLFISLHCNALSDGSEGGGTQVYYQSADKVYDTDQSYVEYQDSMAHEPEYTLYETENRLRLATLIRDNIISRLPALKFDGEKDVFDSDYAILREMNLTSVLVEMGFVTCPDDRSILQDPAGQASLAEAVTAAAEAYYLG